MKIPRISIVFRCRRTTAIAFGSVVVLFLLAAIGVKTRVMDTGKIHVVHLDSTGLRFDGDKICEVVLDTETGSLDFPDSVWTGFALEPLKTRLERLDTLETRSIVLDLPVALDWSTIQPVVRSLGYANAGEIEIHAGSARPVRFLVAGTALSRHSENGETVELIVSKLGVQVRMEGGPIPHAHGPDTAAFASNSPLLSTEFDTLSQILTDIAPNGHPTGHLVIFDKSLDSRRWIHLLETLGSARSRTLPIQEFTLGTHRKAYEERFSEAQDLSPEAIPEFPTELRAWGLDRFYFHPGGAARNATGRVIPFDSLFPEDGHKKSRTFDGSSTEGLVVGIRDFGLPEPGSGPGLEVREVTIREHPGAAFSTYWAVYDADRRTAFWAHETDASRTPMSFSIHQILATPERGLKIRLVGRLARNSVPETRGVEIDFKRKGRDLFLDALMSPFFFGAGDRIVAEKRVADEIETRTTSNPAMEVRESCGYDKRMPDTSKAFDWNRLVRISECIARTKGTTTESRGIHAITYLEEFGL